MFTWFGVPENMNLAAFTVALALVSFLGLLRPKWPKYWLIILLLMQLGASESIYHIGYAKSFLSLDLSFETRILSEYLLTAAFLTAIYGYCLYLHSRKKNR